jgi:hypothetical protein
VSKRIGIVPVNAATNAHYNGLNVLTLWAEREEKQYATPFWITYKQCQAMGGQARGGEKATPIIFVSKTVIDQDAEGRPRRRSSRPLRSHQRRRTICGASRSGKQKPHSQLAPQTAGPFFAPHNKNSLRPLLRAFADFLNNSAVRKGGV